MEHFIQIIELTHIQQHGIPAYTAYMHRGCPPRYPPFEIRLPILFLPWDDDGGMVGFFHAINSSQLLSTSDITRDDSSHLGLCRCGVVKLGKYFRRSLHQFSRIVVYDVAVKIMDKRQLLLQHDTVHEEVSVMAQLQPPGFMGIYCAPYFVQWECSSDSSNEYIATDYAANGSLLMYAKKKITEYKIQTVERLSTTDLSCELETIIHKLVAELWMREALRVYDGVIKGIAYMHAQNVCHLDIDPCNIVIDTNLVPRIIDFGSAEIMSNEGYAGKDNRLIKFKPLYVAKEVRDHNLHALPRPGFLGAPADMWSAGVLLYQLICFGYPRGHLALLYDQNWHHNMICHATLFSMEGRDGVDNDGAPGCLGQEGCLICFRQMRIPPLVYEILQGVLIPDAPAERFTADHVANLIRSSPFGVH